MLYYRVHKPILGREAAFR